MCIEVFRESSGKCSPVVDRLRKRIEIQTVYVENVKQLWQFVGDYSRCKSGIEVWVNRLTRRLDISHAKLASGS